jgi:hypothetical protein
LLGRRRRPDNVAKQNGDELALLDGGLRLGERHTAGKAEAGDIRVVLPAVRAERHAASVADV